VVRDIDIIARQVTYSGWGESQPGDKEARKQIRLVLQKFALPVTGPIFDKAYAYIGVACEFVKYPTLAVGRASQRSVGTGFVGGAGPGVVAGEVDVLPAQGREVSEQFGRRRGVGAIEGCNGSAEV
jgi:hypothetical protein